MKRAGKFAVCFAGGLLCLNSLRADDVVLPGNPYVIVVARNIFGLNPPPPVDPSAGKTVEPPVKIIPNGIMTILGQLQVLFKVTAKPPGKDESYIFTEGQSQDDIEVVKINEKAGIVTFNNHGIVQELPLVATPASSSAAPAPAGGKPAIPVPGIAPAAAPAAGAGGNPFSKRFGSPGGASGGNPANGSSLPSAPAPIGYHPDGPPADPAVQTVVIEATRELYKSTGEVDPRILPQTPLTQPEDGGESSGPPGPDAQQ